MVWVLYLIAESFWNHLDKLWKVDKLNVNYQRRVEMKKSCLLSLLFGDKQYWNIGNPIHLKLIRKSQVVGCKWKVGFIFFFRKFYYSNMGLKYLAAINNSQLTLLANSMSFLVFSSSFLFDEYWRNILSSHSVVLA